MVNITCFSKAEVQYISWMQSKVSATVARSCIAYNLDCADISRRVNEVEHFSETKININGNFAFR